MHVSKLIHQIYKVAIIITVIMSATLSLSPTFFSFQKAIDLSHQTYRQKPTTMPRYFKKAFNSIYKHIFFMSIVIHYNVLLNILQIVLKVQLY